MLVVFVFDVPASAVFAEDHVCSDHFVAYVKGAAGVG